MTRNLHSSSLLVLGLLFATGCSDVNDQTLSETPDELATPPIETPSNLPDVPTASGGDSEILGGWMCQEGAEQEIAFRQANGVNVFQSYLDARPMSVGTWRWNDNALAIEGTGGDYRFDRVSRVGERLTLGNGEGRWVCTLIAE